MWNTYIGDRHEGQHQWYYYPGEARVQLMCFGGVALCLPARGVQKLEDIAIVAVLERATIVNSRTLVAC